jgi:hypothetical protein
MSLCSCEFHVTYLTDGGSYTFFWLFNVGKMSRNHFYIFMSFHLPTVLSLKYAMIFMLIMASDIRGKHKNICHRVPVGVSESDSMLAFAIELCVGHELISSR